MQCEQMKHPILILLLILLYTNISAQADSVTIPDEEYAVYQYDLSLQTNILIYQSGYDFKTDSD